MRCVRGSRSRFENMAMDVGITMLQTEYEGMVVEQNSSLFFHNIARLMRCVVAAVVDSRIKPPYGGITVLRTEYEGMAAE